MRKIVQKIVKLARTEPVTTFCAMLLPTELQGKELTVIKRKQRKDPRLEG